MQSLKMSMSAKPTKSGLVKRHCGKSWHNMYLALWPKKNEAEARLDIHDNESSFLSKLNSGYPLKDASYFFIDEFSAVSWKPLGLDKHSIELVSKNTQKVYLKFAVETRREAMAWIDKISEIIEHHVDEIANQTYACLDSKVKIEKSATKFSVFVNNTTLGESLDAVGQDATVYIQGNVMVLKLKNGRTMQWNFSVVRRYKQKDEAFFMEVGRRADSGAGILHLVCNKAEKLLAAVSKATDNMVRSLPRAESVRKGNDYTVFGEGEPVTPQPQPSAPAVYEELYPSAHPPAPAPHHPIDRTYERLSV